MKNFLRTSRTVPALAAFGSIFMLFFVGFAFRIWPIVWIAYLYMGCIAFALLLYVAMEVTKK